MSAKREAVMMPPGASSTRVGRPKILRCGSLLAIVLTPLLRLPPAGCCKDRAAAWPDRCNGRGVGHLWRGPAGSGAIEFVPGAEGLGVWG